MSKSKLTIFKNEKVGQPIKRNDGSVVEYNGEPMLHCDLNGKINLPEGLPAGDYEVAIYKKKSKSGLSYYAGTIKEAWKKAKPVDAHNTTKANGYVAEEEDLDDSLPF
jgi:hypothetical protein